MTKWERLGNLKRGQRRACNQRMGLIVAATLLVAMVATAAIAAPHARVEEGYFWDTYIVMFEDEEVEFDGIAGLRDMVLEKVLTPRDALVVAKEIDVQLNGRLAEPDLETRLLQRGQPREGRTDIKDASWRHLVLRLTGGSGAALHESSMEQWLANG